MALRYMDSFDHYATADIDKKYDFTSNSPPIDTSLFRFGTGSLGAMGTGASPEQLTKIIDSQPTWIVGFAFYQNGMSTTPFFKFVDGATQHVYLGMNASGKMEVYGPGAVLLGASTTLLTINVWWYIEFKVTIADAGSWDLRINGTSETSGSGDTRNGANASADRFIIGMNGSLSGSFHMDDFYVLDGTGSAPTNDFLGDCRVEALRPNGNGNSSQFTGSDGNSTDNYLLVDENDPGPNDDTDYVESPTVGDKDTYAMANLVTTAGTVYGVQAVPFAKKTDAGVREFVSVARLSATETDSVAKVPSTLYRYYSDIRETKPGGGAWTISDVNSAEFGVKVSA